MISENTRRPDLRLPSTRQSATPERGGADGADAESMKLPFDLGTVWIGVRRRWWMALVGAAVAVAAGSAGGTLLGKRTYQAETALLYRVPRSPDGTEPPHANVSTYMSMVKLQANLAEVRDRLRLKTTVAALGAQCSVRVDRNTELMLIQADSDAPDVAASVANTLRTVFLDRLRSLRKEEIRRQVDDLEQRLTTVRAELADAEKGLREFTATNQIVDLDKQVYWLLDQQTQLEIQYGQAEVDRTRVDLQASNVARIIDQLQKRVAEEKVAASQTEGLGALDIRIRELRSSIDEERSKQANQVRLKFLEDRLHRFQEMAKQDAATTKEVEDAIAEYEHQKALSVDTPQITGWKEEMAKLQEVVRPEPGGQATASTPILQHMMMQEFTIQLEQVAAGEKVKQFGTALQRTREKLKELPVLQGRHTELKRQVEAKEEAKKSIEQLLAGQRNALQWEDTCFSVVSEAHPPALPSGSTRRKIALAIVAAGVLLSGVSVLGLELADSTVKSPADAGLRVSAPVLGSVPLVAGESAGGFDARQVEPMRIVAERLRRALPGPGVCVLVSSAAPGEGKTTVAANLARCFGYRGERVLLVDGHLRPAEPERAAFGLLPSASARSVGLSDYLANRELSADAIVQPTRVAGVDCLPRGSREIGPDLLAAPRMRELLAQLSLKYGIIVVDTGPVLSAVEAEMLAGLADGALLVLRSRLCRAAVLREARARLEATGVNLLGTVLNAVEPAYAGSNSPEPVLRAEEAVS